MPIMVNNPYTLFGGPTFQLLFPATIADVGANPFDGVAGARVARDGSHDSYQENSAGYTDLGLWIDPDAADVGDDYEVRLTVNSGSSPTSGTAGSWLAVTSDRLWTLERTTIGTSTGNWTIEIRDVATQTVQVSDTFDISAQKTF